MTREEYRHHTHIQNEEEARALMTKAKVLFACIFVGMVVINVLVRVQRDVEAAPLFGGMYCIAYAYFVYHCWKITKLTEKVTRAEVLFAFFFAPISWIWFYDALLEPLQIIVGERDVPDHLPVKKELTNEQRENIRRNTWRTIGHVTLMVFVAVLLIAVAIAMFGG